MTARTKLLVAIGALGIASLLFFAWRSQRVLERGLPPREVCANEADAAARAMAHGGRVVGILGTGSMAPHIPAGDPAAVVALVVLRDGGRFLDIKAGDLIIYRPTFVAKGAYAHQAAQRDSLGWVMSGLANANSESSSRVTSDNFIGIVAKTFVWSP